MNRLKVICVFGALMFGAGRGYGESAAPLHELHPLSDPSPLPLNAVAENAPGVVTSKDGIRIRRPVNQSRGSTVLKIKPEAGTWDCSKKLWLLADISNQGNLPVLVRSKIGSPSSPLPEKGIRGGVLIPARQQRILPVLIRRKIDTMIEEHLNKAFGGISGLPGGHQNASWNQVDAEALNTLELEFFTEEDSISCTVSNIRTAVDFRLPEDAGPYTPGTDRFGQELQHDWPAKIKTESDLKRAKETEKGWLQEHPPLPGRSRYGGWEGGPQLEATGHFYTTKIKGKWWLVDPDGALFWSLGITGVGCRTGSTKTPGLNQILKTQPEGELDLRAFPHLNAPFWSPYQANLRRKYGVNWKTESIGVAHERLHAWGFNTLGNWSEEEFCKALKTPYVTAVHYSRATLGGGDISYGTDLPDVFHPEFREKTFTRMETEVPETASDPWCIGYFIDNELGFAKAETPAWKALSAPETCYTRQEFIARLQKKYRTVNALNSAWNGTFEDWSGLTPLPSTKSAAYREDLKEFSEYYLRTYYQTCRDAIKAAAPQKLYLGSRINHTQNSTALRICAEYADAVSINLYDYTPDIFKLPAGVDKPVIIGEFHFGTITEQGVWGAGLASGMDIAHSAELFRAYVQAALRDPMIIGAHWFQLMDQPLTGRNDGENYRIGFLNVADIPYFEMAEASREISAAMYDLRGKKRE